MQKVTYEGKYGYLDEETSQFFPKEIFDEVTYEGKLGILHRDTNQFFQVEGANPSTVGENLYRKARVFAGGTNIGLANILGTPVDLINLALSTVGLGTPEPIAGSESIKKLMPEAPKPEGLAENIIATTGEQVPYIATSFIPGLGAAAKTETIKRQIIEGAKFGIGAGAGGGIVKTIAPENEWAKLGGEMVGGFTPAGAGLTIEKIARSKLPERIYGSAVKTPLSKKWVQTLGEEEASKRMKALAEGVKEKVPPSEYGISKAKKLEEDVRGEVDKIINEATAKGDPTIKTADILDTGLRPAYEIAADSSDPIGAKAIIDDFRKTFMEGHGEEMTVAKANAVKRQLYKETKWTGNAQTGLTAQLSESMKKGVSHEMMLELENRYPVLDSLNATDAARIDLKEAIERSVNRYGNTDLLGLGAKVLTGRNIPFMIWEATMGHPQVKARLAFALDKARAGARRIGGEGRLVPPEIFPGFETFPPEPRTLPPFPIKTPFRGPGHLIPATPEKPVIISGPTSRDYLFNAPHRAPGSFIIDRPIADPVQEAIKAKAQEIVRPPEPRTLPPYNISPMFQGRGRNIIEPPPDSPEAFLRAKIIEAETKKKIDPISPEVEKVAPAGGGGINPIPGTMEKILPKKEGTLISWIRSKGGINPKDWAEEFTTKETGVVGISNKNGVAMDELLAQAKEAGWIVETATEKDFVNLIKSDIKASKGLGEKATKITGEKIPEEKFNLSPEEQEGFIGLKRKEELKAGDLNKGDELLIKGERYEHKGFDSEGRAIIKDGETYRLDPWDTIEADAIKRTAIDRQEQILEKIKQESPEEYLRILKGNTEQLVQEWLARRLAKAKQTQQGEMFSPPKKQGSMF